MRTGFTLVMFALILYIVTVGAVFNNTQQTRLARVRDAQLSGYDASIRPKPDTTITDFAERVGRVPALRVAVLDYAELAEGYFELPEHKAGNYGVDFGHRGGLPVTMTLRETVTFAPANFLDSTTDRLDVRLPQYASDRDVWGALKSDPSLAVLPSFYAGSDEHVQRPRLMPGDTLLLRDPASGNVVRKTVAGLLAPSDSVGPPALSGIVLGAGAQGDFPELRLSRLYLVHLSRGADPKIAERGLNQAFAGAGAESVLVDQLLSQTQQAMMTVIRLVQLFLALGLIVGVAGLGVISARAVHERYHDIGTLRAIGFERGAVGWQFVIESSLVALLGITIGIGTGVLGGYTLFRFVLELPDTRAVFPWAEMILPGLGAWVATLLFTLGPARHATRVLPVEALRYSG